MSSIRQANDAPSAVAGRSRAAASTARTARQPARAGRFPAPAARAGSASVARRAPAVVIAKAVRPPSMAVIEAVVVIGLFLCTRITISGYTEVRVDSFLSLSRWVHICAWRVQPCT